MMFLIRLVRLKGKKDRKSMAKNLSKRGKSVRNGNAPSPYTKYNKTPYKYDMKKWARADREAAGVITLEPFTKPPKRSKYLEAAE